MFQNSNYATTLLPNDCNVCVTVFIHLFSLEWEKMDYFQFINACFAKNLAMSVSVFEITKTKKYELNE